MIAPELPRAPSIASAAPDLELGDAHITVLAFLGHGESGDARKESDEQDELPVHFPRFSNTSLATGNAEKTFGHPV